MNKLVFFLPVIMTVIANTLYHISARDVSSKVDPFFSLIISYGVALLGSLVLFLVTKHQPISANWHALTWPSVTLGAAIIFIEFGYMWSYQVGWPIKSTALTINLLNTVLLMILGVWLFHEGVNVRNILGIGLAVISIWLLNA